MILPLDVLEACLHSIMIVMICNTGLHTHCMCLMLDIVIIRKALRRIDNSKSSNNNNSNNKARAVLSCFSDLAPRSQT
jgi:hypothetical protein